MLGAGYESVQEAAARLGVTARAVQKWAAAGRLVGARKLGRTWFIPVDAKPDDASAASAPVTDPESGVILFRPAGYRQPLPLMNGSFAPGQALRYAQSLPDPDDRAIALAEFHYYSGDCQQAAQLAEPYLDSEDPSLRYSSALIVLFANLSLGHTHIASHAMHMLEERAAVGRKSDSPVLMHGLAALALTTIQVQLHLDRTAQPLEEYIHYLPDGMKLFGCFLLSHRAYLEKDYAGSLAMARTGIALFPQEHVVAQIHAHLSAAIALINLKRPEEARRYMEKAWLLAEPDGLLQPFVEHHGLLQGMVEVFFKKEYPQVFAQLIAYINIYGAGWRGLHNQHTGSRVTDELTTTEFSVAMLYNRGWSAQEVAAHMGISEHTVRSYIKTIYIKLGISDKNGLAQYMLR